LLAAFALGAISYPPAGKHRKEKYDLKPIKPKKPEKERDGGQCESERANEKELVTQLMRSSGKRSTERFDVARDFSANMKSDRFNASSTIV
jgi:hypothetical protein